MITRRSLLMSSAIGVVAGRIAIAGAAETFEITHTDVEWRKLLTPAQYAVLRQSATERPFTSRLLDEHRRGTFGCAGANLACSPRTRSSRAARVGPASGPLDKASAQSERATFGMIRTAVHCARCGGHLGHVFDGTENRPACAIA